MTPRDLQLTAAGGNFDVTVSTAAGCAWSASSSAAFASLVSAASSNGPGSARFAASVNTGGSTRQGTVRISFATGGGQDVNVSQLAPEAPPASGPAVQDFVAVRTDGAVSGSQLVSGQPPRSNAGGCGNCPILNSAEVTLGSGISSATRNVAKAISGSTRAVTVHLETTNMVPFNTVILTTGDLIDGTPQASSYFLIHLASSMTSVSLALDVATGTAFIAQFAVTTNSEPPSNYVPALLTQGSGTPVFNGTLSATPVVTFGSASCQYTQQFTNVAIAIAISAGTVTQSEVTATGVESVLAGCSATPIPPNQQRYVLQASSILLNGTSIKVTYSQPAGQPAVSLTFEGTISGDVITGTLIFRRTDNPSLPWTLTAPVTLTRQGA